MYEITITNESKQELAQVTAKMTEILQVTTDSEARAADALVKQGKTLVKVIHDERMAVSRKVDSIKKQLISQETSICADINAELARVGKLCTDYLTVKAQEEESRRRAEEIAAAEEAEAAAAEALLTGRAVPMPIAEEKREASKPVAGVSSRTYWTFTITAPAEVPRAYCSPDERLIREYMDNVKRGGGRIEDLNIPGVTFRKDIRI